MGSFYLWDASKRYEDIAICPSTKEIEAFSRNPNNETRQAIYQKFLYDDNFNFPRKKVHAIKVIKNRVLTGRLFSHYLTKEKIKDLINFLNQPDNFTWQEVDMRHADSKYILIFYDKQHRKIGKLWFDPAHRQILAVPFSPHMKFGHLKRDKAAWLLKFLKNN